MFFSPTPSGLGALALAGYLSLLPHPAPALVDSPVEAELSTYVNATSASDPLANGGAYLRLDADGRIWFDVTTTSRHQVLHVTYRTRTAGRSLDVVVDGDDLGARPLRDTRDEWAVLALEVPGWQSGAHVVDVGTSQGSSDVDVDSVVVCDTGGGSQAPCGGCEVAPLSPSVASDGHKSISVPVPPGLPAPFRLLSLVKVTGTTMEVLDVTATPTSGACSWQASDPQSPCSSSSVCKEESPCKVTLQIKFRANDYIRPPFWDSTETVTAPDGSQQDFGRTHQPYTISRSGSAPCGGSTVNVTVGFENGGSVVQPLRCEPCR